MGIYVTISNKRAATEALPPKKPLKTELQVLRLSEDGQTTVLDTLRHIHGQDFQLPSKAQYVDKGSRMKTGYWEERGNLIIQGGCDYSDFESSGDLKVDRDRMFAMLKLESYGFHKSHCIEALKVCDDDVNQSLQLLYYKYFPDRSTETASADLHSDEEIAEMREDELSALESIYDTAFEVEVPNQVWMFKFQIDHLLMHSPHERRKRQNAENQAKLNVKHKSANKEKCKQFKLGKCKFKDRCRYSHVVETDESGTSVDASNDPNWFYVEIRFPPGNKYPFEAPMVFLKSTCPDLPPMFCLRLTRRLIEEAREVAKDGMPSVYTLTELLQLDTEVTRFLRTDRHRILDAKQSLFQDTLDDNDNVEDRRNLPTHYAKGRSLGVNILFLINIICFKGNNGPRLPQSAASKHKDDIALTMKFQDKQSNTHYLNMLKTRKSLPAWNMMETILETVDKHPVKHNYIQSQFYLFQ